jgi:hypothetical protein
MNNDGIFETRIIRIINIYLLCTLSVLYNLFQQLFPITLLSIWTFMPASTNRETEAQIVQIICWINTQAVGIKADLLLTTDPDFSILGCKYSGHWPEPVFQILKPRLRCLHRKLLEESHWLQEQAQLCPCHRKVWAGCEQTLGKFWTCFS